MHWAWQRFLGVWFQPTAALNLAICRVLFFSGLFLYYVRTDYAGYAEVDDVFWQPVWLHRVLGLKPASSINLFVLQTLWKLSLLTSAMGMATRYSTWFAGIVGAYLIGLPHCFGKTYHDDAMTVLFLLVMANARCGDVLSCDAWWRSRKTKANSEANLAILTSAEYCWPLQLMRVLFVVMYFAAGLSKLKVSGLDWITSDYMQRLLGYHHYTGTPATTWGLWLAHWPLLCQAMAGTSILIELSTPLALFNNVCRRTLIPATYLMHVGIWLLLGPWFLNMIFCCVVWVDWQHFFGERFKSLAETPGKRSA